MWLWASILPERRIARLLEEHLHFSVGPGECAGMCDQSAWVRVKGEAARRTKIWKVQQGTVMNLEAKPSHRCQEIFRALRGRDPSSSWPDPSMSGFSTRQDQNDSMMLTIWFQITDVVVFRPLLVTVGDHALACCWEDGAEAAMRLGRLLLGRLPPPPREN